jgi:hypothetical protein
MRAQLKLQRVQLGVWQKKIKLFRTGHSMAAITQPDCDVLAHLQDQGLLSKPKLAAWGIGLATRWND